MYGSLAVMASEGSGSAMSQSGHWCNMKLSAVSQLSLRLGYRRYLATGRGSSLLEGSERERPFGRGKAEDDIEL